MESSHIRADLLDRLCSKLEHIRSVTWSVADQVDRLCDQSDVKDVVSGEVGLIYAQLLETQSILEQLNAEVVHAEV